MFSKRKRNYRVVVITALIISICVLIAVILWPDKPEPITSDLNVNVQADTVQDDDLENIIKDKEESKDENTNIKNKTYYIVKKSGEVISVFFVSEDGKEIKLEDTEILYELLPPEDQTKFDTGIILEEQEDLSSLLQDFEG